MNTWIDVHTHLNMLEMTPEDTLKEAKTAGVERVITIGTNAEDHPVVVELARKFYPEVHCALGVHPHEAKDFNEEVEAYMRENLPRQEVVAVGEIGLDFYYEHSPRETQEEVFRKQMQLAEEFELPIEIHTRDAEPETIQVLQEFQGRVKGLIHCFTGSMELAMKALDFGFNISFSGVVTFKNADALREVVKAVPMDRLHVETDAPFLTPVPFRGKKNTPAYVVHTAEKVAELKGVTLEQLAAETKKNARQLFTKLNW